MTDISDVPKLKHLLFKITYQIYLPKPNNTQIRAQKVTLELSNDH